MFLYLTNSLNSKPSSELPGKEIETGLPQMIILSKELNVLPSHQSSLLLTMRVYPSAASLLIAGVLIPVPGGHLVLQTLTEFCFPTEACASLSLRSQAARLLRFPFLSVLQALCKTLRTCFLDLQALTQKGDNQTK